MTPKVSIIVPNYNHARFLDRRLSSILCQSFQDFELILLDDASTDNSLEILKPYLENPNVRSAFNEHNSGSPFVQWNRGLEMSRGEYVWIAESDDFCEPSFLEVLVSALDNHPESGLAYAQSWIVSESDEKLEVLDWYAVFGTGARWAKDFTNTGCDEITRFLAIQNTIPNASAVLIRKAALAPDLRAPENLRLCGDWLFWINILKDHDVTFIAEPLNCFRQTHSASQRRASLASGREAVESFEIQQKILREIKPARKYRRRMFNHHLRRWGSLVFHENLPRNFDHRMRAQFEQVYSEGGNFQFIDQLRLLLFYWFVIPGMRTAIYRQTISNWRGKLKK